MMPVIITTTGIVTVATAAMQTLKSELKLTQAPILHPTKANGVSQKQLRHGPSPVTNLSISGEHFYKCKKKKFIFERMESL